MAQIWCFKMILLSKTYKVFHLKIDTLYTARPMNFKRNLKYFQWDLRRVKEHAPGVHNIFCLKSKINGHRNGQLGSLAEQA